MKFLDAEGVRQLKELNDSTYVGKDEYNDDTMVISAALNDLNSRLTDAEADIAGASGGDINVIETIKVNGSTQTITNKAVDITVPTKVSDLTNDSGFTSNVGTITGITMNGSSKGTSGVVNLGTVITAHQDISGKEDISNKVTSISSSSTDTQYPSAKCVYDAIQNNNKWRLIRHDTLSSAVTTITITSDSDNEAFLLSNVLVYIKMISSPPTGSTGTIRYYSSASTTTYYELPLIYGPYSDSGTYDMHGINQVRILDEIIMPVLALTSASNSDRRMVSFEEKYYYYSTPIVMPSINKIVITNTGIPNFYGVGTEYYIWGINAE